jgi:hypothetical protein
MRASDLIAALEDLVVEYGDLDVMIAYQPNYPLASPAVNVTACWLNGERTVFVAGGGSGEYAPRAAWEEPSLDDEDDDEEVI